MRNHFYAQADITKTLLSMEITRNFNDVTGVQLFQLRTNSKRAHTRLVTRINGLLGRRATKFML